MTKTFGEWQGELHARLDQQKRIASAKKAATTPDSIDKVNYTGIFAGSGKDSYQTTLNHCTCGDFFNRHLPCKHIYRLAMECGLFEGGFQTGTNKNIEMRSQITLAQAVSALEMLSDENQMVIRDLLYHTLFCGEPFVTMKPNAELQSCALIESSKVSPERALSKWKKRQLTTLLSEQEIYFAKTAKKADLLTLCIEKIPNIENIVPSYFDVSFVDAFKKAQRSLYFYLLRKYDWETFYCRDMTKMRHPRGAISEQLLISFYMDSANGILEFPQQIDPYRYWFPADEITRLLTKYGHNRCLNGFIAEAAEE